MRMARDQGTLVSQPPGRGDANGDGTHKRERGADLMTDDPASADAASFTAIAPQHTAAMLRVAAALVGWSDAEDAAQEALTRAWQAWPTLRDVSSARPWLLQITVNVCRQWQRGGFGRRVRSTEPLPEEGDATALALLDADLGTTDHTGSLDLRAAINALDPDLRVIVALRYYGGMDASEIGLALGAPPPTIRTRLRRALGILRDTLGANDSPATRQSEGDSDVQ